jgi:hypothetical protein
MAFDYTYDGAKIDTDLVKSAKAAKAAKNLRKEEDEKKKKKRKKKVDDAVSDIKKFKMKTGNFGTLE